MKKFQDLVTKEKEKLKSKQKQKLSFRGLGSTVDLNQAMKIKKVKENYPSFRALAGETKECFKHPQTIKENVEFTLKKEETQQHNSESEITNNISQFSDDEFQFIPRNKPKPKQSLEGISMIDSVIIDENECEDPKQDCQNKDLSTTEKNQVEHQLSKVALNLKRKLFDQSKTMNSFKEAMIQANTIIQIETQRSYSKILQQRAICRGRSISSPPKSGALNPVSHSFLSIVSKRSPLFKFQSNKTSPLQFESPQTSANTNSRKQKSTSKQIKQKIVKNQGVKVTEFKFE